MTDYHPVLARAVSRLAIDTALARKEFYEQAQGVLVAQLRRRNPQISASEIMLERAALETAIHRVEAESLSILSHSSAGPLAPRPSAALADNGHDVGIQQKRSIQDEAKVRQAPAQHEERDTSKSPTANVTIDISGIPESLGKMLFGIAFVVGMMAFIGVFYIRGVVLVSQHVIGYPVLLAVMLMVCLFIFFLPLAIFRAGPRRAKPMAFSARTSVRASVNSL
jgi:hypothetical protein